MQQTLRNQRIARDPTDEIGSVRATGRSVSPLDPAIRIEIVVIVNHAPAVAPARLLPTSHVAICCLNRGASGAQLLLMVY
jgi:hypothetical protein